MADRKQFDPKDEITGMVDAAYALFAPKQRDETVGLHEIEQATGLTRYQGSWGTVIKKVKRRSEDERGITIWPVPGGGAYKLCTAKQQLFDVSRARNRRARKQLLLNLKSLEALPADELEGHDQHVRAQLVFHLRQRRRELRRDGRDTNEFLARKTEVLPRVR